MGLRPWRASMVGTCVTSPPGRLSPEGSCPKAAEPWYLKTPVGR
jgi:hypothetical protein